ncbi:hypothetical protein, partial [Vibrio sp. YT-19(2023)]|uniref:hypothetical protein n=1 Tax=Vibrio sp. YT-19(2023) TaxID=3074710 RepID=UPI002964C302
PQAEKTLTQSRKAPSVISFCVIFYPIVQSDDLTGRPSVVVTTTGSQLVNNGGETGGSGCGIPRAIRPDDRQQVLKLPLSHPKICLEMSMMEEKLLDQLVVLPMIQPLF